MKKVLMVFLCGIFAVALAVSGCSKNEGGEKTEGGEKAAAGEKTEKGGEKAVPKSGLDAMGDQLCKAALDGDVDALLELMPPPMLDMMKEFAAMGAEEGEDPMEALKAEMAEDMGKDKPISCEVVSAEETECGEEVTTMFEQMGLDAPTTCGSITIKSQVEGEEEEEDSMDAVKIEDKWYMGGGM